MLIASNFHEYIGRIYGVLVRNYRKSYRIVDIFMKIQVSFKYYSDLRIHIEVLGQNDVSFLMIWKPSDVFLGNDDPGIGMQTNCLIICLGKPILSSSSK